MAKLSGWIKIRRIKKMRKTITMCTLALLILSMFSGLAFAESSDSKIITVSLVNQDPDPAISGDVVEIRLGVENTGGAAAENLILEVVPEYPFTMVSGESSINKVGTLQAYQTDFDMKIVKFKIRVDRDAIAGEYELKIKQYEEGKESVSTQISVSIDVKSKESAEVIYIDKTLLVPGKQTSMKFTINNVGSAPLRDLTFNWENEDNIILPVGSDNTKYIKYIDIGDSAELDYQVIADTNAEPGLYKLNLYLKYDDPLSDEEKEISTIAGVYVGGGTDFDIAFSESSAGQTSFTIANIGSNPAYSVSVIIPQQQGWRVSGSNSMIIGNLNKGDYTVASFNLQSSQARTMPTDQEEMTREELMALREKMQTEGTGNALKIQIAYTDTLGERNSVKKDVIVNTQATTTPDASSMPAGANFRGMRQQSFFSQYKWQIIGILVLVVGIVMYRRYKKEKKANPKFKFRDLFKRKKK
jgi:hypothetical protein